jgi:hypothetical protein
VPVKRKKETILVIEKVIKVPTSERIVWRLNVREISVKVIEWNTA